MSPRVVDLTTGGPDPLPDGFTKGGQNATLRIRQFRLSTRLIHVARSLYPWLVSWDLIICAVCITRFLTTGSEGLTRALLQATQVESATEAQRVLGYGLLSFAVLLAITVLLFAMSRLGSDKFPPSHRRN